MSHCEILPKCSPRKLACQRPNAWVIFMMAHSKDRQTVSNAGILNKGISFKAKARKYRSLARSDGVLCLDRDGDAVRRSDNLSLCTVYRQMRNIVFPDDLVLPQGSAETQAWATSVVSGKPKRYNKIYGFSAGRIRRPRGDLLSRDVRSVRDRTWLNDEVINRFMSLLWPLCSARQTIIIDTQVTAPHTQGSRLAQQGQRVIDAAIAFCNMTDVKVKFTLFPYNLNEDHWFLVLYDHEKHAWQSLDSFNGDHGDLIRAQFHKPLMKTKPASVDARGRGFSYSVTRVPQQPDFFQCGIWTCLLALCLLTNHKLPERAFSHPRTFAMRGRLFIAKTMHTNSLSLIRDPAVDLQSVVMT